MSIKPLTIEELKQRIGKPIYVVDSESNIPDDNFWCIVKSVTNELGDRWLRINDMTGIHLGRIKNGSIKCYDHEVINVDSYHNGMKISEMIKQLEKIKACNGDLDCMTIDEPKCKDISSIRVENIYSFEEECVTFCMIK